MKITHEIVDGEHFIDLILSKDELDGVKENYLISDEVNFMGKKLNLGVALALKGSAFYATEERIK